MEENCLFTAVVLMDMFFLSVPKINYVFQITALKIEKDLSSKNKYMCYFYEKCQIFEFIWSHIFTLRNAEDMEAKVVEQLWRSCNPLVLKVELSSHTHSNCEALNKTGTIFHWSFYLNIQCYRYIKRAFLE